MNERSLNAKASTWLEWKLERPREIFAQMIVDLCDARAARTRRRKFSRIENIFRIERAFDLAHHSEQLIAELLAHVFRARDADAVLGGERTFELPHQRGGLIGDLPEFFQIGRAVQIEHGSNMQQVRWRRVRNNSPPARAVS